MRGGDGVRDGGKKWSRQDLHSLILHPSMQMALDFVFSHHPSLERHVRLGIVAHGLDFEGLAICTERCLAAAQGQADEFQSKVVFERGL